MDGGEICGAWKGTPGLGEKAPEEGSMKDPLLSDQDPLWTAGNKMKQQSTIFESDVDSNVDQVTEKNVDQVAERIGAMTTEGDKQAPAAATNERYF